MFFTNDFGLLDLRKTSVVIGVGLDIEDDEVVLTAQLAVPQPAENGENTKFNVVTGKGATVASALNEVNVKTGFYPKMVFCKLIILGETCFSHDIASLLDYFYRNEYTGLTLSVAACEKKASELIGQQFPCGNSATDVIDKLLSSEAQASGNVAATNLKELGEKLFSKSSAAYMPYLENGIMEESGGGEGGESGGGGGGGGSGQCEESELVCNKCAVFSNGYFKGVLPIEQTFALNLLFNDVRHAFVETGEGEQGKVLGLRDCKGSVDLKIENGAPVVNFKFNAVVKVQDEENGFSPEKIKQPEVKEEVLNQGEKSICTLFEELYNSVRTLDCDVLGLRTQLYKKFNDRYNQYADVLLNNATVTCEIKLKSSA
ncbi:MAG: hypothetical protein K2O67_03695 [Clostridia bacterium]|nr:hypothetical protein [Clostridia bacterium]